MLQVTEIREHKEKMIAALTKRGIDATQVLEEVVKTDELRRNTQAKLDETLAQSNTFSKEIGMLFKKGETQKAAILKEKTVQLKEVSKVLNEQLNEASEKLQELLFTIPNIPNELVPDGTDETNNEQVFQEGSIPVLAEGSMPHWELAKKYDIINFELGVKITGAGFPVYKGKGARLQRALIAYFLDKNTGAGYTEYQVPHLVNEASGYGTGQLPDKEGQLLKFLLLICFVEI
jgi:seryl-tRNA synthetase